MAGIDPHRYRRVRRFVVGVLVHLLWWDVLLSRRPLSRFRRPAIERWRRIAREYRNLAVDMGGVLIKLGQFLSVRVDLLPPEIIAELAGLQDEVPAGPVDALIRQLEEDFARPLPAIFAELAPEAIGAASLAQVHRARLPGGEVVVVKMLRPGIDVLVATDLAALDLALRWLRLSSKISRRVNLTRLAEEFRTTTERELDLQTEGRNLERFAENFAADPRVGVPRVYWEASARRTLCLEDVGYFKLADLAAVEAAGIRRQEVATTLYRLFLEQIFLHHFVHADPHPGNLFVRPLPGPGEAPFRPGDPVPFREGREFQLIFIDFGMVAFIPDYLQGALREIAIAFGRRDAERLVRAYAAAGILLPGADLARLTEVHREVFARFRGVSLGKLRQTALSEATYFFREYRDLLYAMPFQVQVDLLFTSRALGLLAGMATRLTPEFDPWAEIVPFAEQLARGDLRRHWKEWLELGLQEARVLLELPTRLDRLLEKAERGQLGFQVATPSETQKALVRIERSLRRLNWTLLAGALFLGALILHRTEGAAAWPLWLGGAAAAAFLWGLATSRSR